MDNSGESGDDAGPHGTAGYFTTSGVPANYIGVQSDDLEGMDPFFYLSIPKMPILSSNYYILTHKFK